MIQHYSPGATLLVFGVLALSQGSAVAQTTPKAEPKPAPQAARKAAPRKSPAPASAKPVLEAKAIEILKASSSRLAAARSLSFTAVVTYESPTRLGPPLAYTTRSEVILQRPDKLRVLTTGDGPASEFYYDGKTMMAFAPAENLVAVADAPPTVDAALEAAYHSAAIYFPFSDVIATDPYKDISDDLRIAFYVGQSNVVGGTTTDIVVYDSGGAFVQAWIGVEDKLPRMLRAIYMDDPLRLRHQLEITNWKMDPAIPADVFASTSASAAKKIPFARPDPQLPAGAKPPAKTKAKPVKPPAATQ